MAVNHWSNQVLLAGANLGLLTWPSVQIVIGPMKTANDEPMKKARLNFIGPMKYC